MTKCHIFPFVLILLSLVGCSQQVALSTNLTEGNTPTITGIPFPSPKPSITPPRLPIPFIKSSQAPLNPSSTPAQRPEDFIRYKPIKIADALPGGTNPPGTLILEGYGGTPSYFINFTQESRQEIPKDRTCFSTSPDGMWLAYCQGSKQNARDWLFIESSTGEIKNKLPIEASWFFANPRWLDNERLVFDLLNTKSGVLSSILPVEVVNPFSGDHQELASDYPGLLQSNIGPGGSTMDFVDSTVVYHPSLDLVIYPQTTVNGLFVVLWDRKTKQALARVEELGGFGHLPLWSPDGEEFVITVVPQEGARKADYNEFIDEWFSVSQKGKVLQLTHFVDFFSDARIGRANWSPDGQLLAFFLRTNPSECGDGEQPAVMDVKTRMVTIYCTPGAIRYGGPPPIWSPDSQYFAFNSSNPSGNLVLVVAINQAAAIQIVGDLYPSGWLVTP